MRNIVQRVELGNNAIMFLTLQHVTARVEFIEKVQCKYCGSLKAVPGGAQELRRRKTVARHNFDVDGYMVDGSIIKATPQLTRTLVATAEKH